jgi:plasmid replication initiation protein
MDALFYAFACGRKAKPAPGMGGGILRVVISRKCFCKAISAAGGVEVKSERVAGYFKAVMAKERAVCYEKDGESSASRCFLKVSVRGDDVAILFDEDIARMFWRLSGSFTQFAFKCFASLKSANAKRLYLYLRTCAGTPIKIGTAPFSTAMLQRVFNGEGKYMRKRGGFNRAQWEKRTIKRAVQEINDKTDLKIKYRKDRYQNGPIVKVKGYVFNFWAKDPAKNPVRKSVRDRIEGARSETEVRSTKEEAEKWFEEGYN